MNERNILREYPKDNPYDILVYGDNYHRRGTRGVTLLQDESIVYGFITKKTPSSNPEDYFTLEEYHSVFERELEKLVDEITRNPKKQYLISRIGGGIANRYGIFESIIEPRIKKSLKQYRNVEFLW
jgi:hypothetical protein